jgi:Tfp pilus assembly protein PilF
MKRVFPIFILCAFIVCLVSAEPQRDKGLSLYILPESVAKLSHKQGGFQAYSENNKKEIIFQSSFDVLKHFTSLSQEIQDNGIWVVITNPDAYSKPEKQLYESLKKMCLDKNIPLFASRASKLANGWIQGNLFSIENSDEVYKAMDTVKSGWEYFNKGDLDTALKKFNQATEIEPNFAPAYFGEAYIYSVQEKLDLAIKGYKKSIEKDPTHSPSYSNLGLALIYSDKPAEAFPMLEKALKIDPKNGNAHVNIAIYYFRVEDYANSWKHIHIAEELKEKINLDFLKDLKSKSNPVFRP